jgi:hypothetical protein
MRTMTAWASAAILLAGLLPAAGPAAAAPAAPPQRLANLAHLDFMYDTVTPPEQDEHTTYRLAEEPSLGVVWTYGHHNPDGSYTPVGGGAHDAATDTWGQGAYNTDDVTRTSVAYLRHWRQNGDDHSRRHAYQLLRGAAYFQDTAGPNRGNFEIWMQPDGAIQHVQNPNDGNDEQANWSLARGIWAYGEGYAAFRDSDPAFAAFLADRLALSFDALEREVLDKYGQYQVVDGLRWPRWFIPGCYCEPYGDAGATADAMQGLVAYLKVTRGAADAGTRALRARAERITTQFAEGLRQMALGDAYTWPFGAIMPNPGYRSVWHGWGTMMPGVLAEAGELLQRRDWIDAAVTSMARFAPHVLAQGGPDAYWAPTPVLRIQWGFAVDNLVQNLYKVGTVAHQDGLRDLAGFAAAWYFGDNYGSARMYSPQTGRLYDGLEGNGNVNTNAGAETSHAVMSMLLLDANPDLARRALAWQPGDRYTWQQVEAEDGVRSGDTALGEPCQFVVAEGWCSGREVILKSGGSVRLTVDVPRDGRYLLMPAFTRMQTPAGAVAVTVSANDERLATVDVGGAGPQGVTPRPGYHDVVTLDQPVDATQRRLTVDIAYSGEAGHEIRLDAVLVQPVVEWHVAGEADAAQALLRSFSRGWEAREVSLPGDGPVTARAYDTSGRLVRTAVGRSGTIDAPVPPGGFTLVTGGSLTRPH